MIAKKTNGNKWEKEPMNFLMVGTKNEAMPARRLCVHERGPVTMVSKLFSQSNV